MRIRLAELVEVLGGRAEGIDAELGEVAVSNVAIHSGRIHSSSVFFALPGARTDGHAFVERALEHRALAAVVRRRPEGAEPGALPLILVEDPLAALQRLAIWWRAQLDGTPGFEVVAIVGSNGKTTTKDALVHLLASRGRVYGSPGSYNSQLGVPLAVLDCPPEARVAVFELGASEPGEMARLEAIVRPTHVLVTNLGVRWRSNFASDLDHARQMLASASRVDAAGWLLIGAPDPTLSEASRALRCRVRELDADPELPRVVLERTRAAGSSVSVAFPGRRAASCRLQTVSDEIIADIHLALAAAWLLGASADELLDAVDGYAPTSTCREVWRSPEGIQVIRDVATPDPLALGSALRAGRRLAGPEGRVVLVMASFPELADSARAVERFVGVLRAERVDVAYARAGAWSGRIQAELAAQLAGQPGPRVEVFESDAQLRAFSTNELRPQDVLVVQSSPSRSLVDVAPAVVDELAPTRLYIDLSAVEDNVAEFRRCVGPRVQIMGMVKALGYGTDARLVCEALEAAGVDALAVSAVDEGVALRKAGIASPILVLLGSRVEFDKLVRHALTPLVYSAQLVDKTLDWARATPSGSSPLTIHVEINTGMNRTGLSLPEFAALLDGLARAGSVRLVGLMTHLASADDPEADALTARQLQVFEAASRMASEAGFTDVVRHAAATAAALRVPEARFDMIRVGLGLYGFAPSAAAGRLANLTPAVGLVSRIFKLTTLAAGERVGYGGTWVAPRDGTRIGLVPTGYADGVPRALSNVGCVVVDGVRCPIVGAVSMDSMQVDVSACASASVGSNVLIFGQHGGQTNDLVELAAAAGTIPYELMTRVGPRVQRIFTRH